MIDAVELLTVPFVDEGHIGLLVKNVEKSLEGTPEVKAGCKVFSAKMKKVYYQKKKKKGVPEDFKPIKDIMLSTPRSPARGSSGDKRKGDGDNIGGEDACKNGNTFGQKHPIGTWHHC